MYANIGEQIGFLSCGVEMGDFERVIVLGRVQFFITHGVIYGRM